MRANGYKDSVPTLAGRSSLGVQSVEFTGKLSIIHLTSTLYIVVRPMANPSYLLCLPRLASTPFCFEYSENAHNYIHFENIRKRHRALIQPILGY